MTRTKRHGLAERLCGSNPTQASHPTLAGVASKFLLQSMDHPTVRHFTVKLDAIIDGLANGIRVAAKER